MPVDIDTWLREREKEATEELAHFEREAEKRRAALDMLRRWRTDLARKTPDQLRAVSAQPAGGPFNGMPEFDSASDPTGKRRAIWELLNDERPTPFSPKEMRKVLIRRGEIPPQTAPKDVQMTARRMAEAGQIEKAGRGQYRLPPLTNPFLREAGRAEP